jgi:hypothetical protein
MQRKRRVAFAIWVTLWAIIVIAALALIHHCRRLVRDSTTLARSQAAVAPIAIASPLVAHLL